MKARINRFETACVLIGCYGGYGEGNEYHEAICENIELKKLDKSITKHVYLHHDITVHVVPGVEVRVFAKNLRDIKTCLEIEENPDYFKAMLDCWSKYNNSMNGEYIWTTFELEELIKEKDLPPIVF